MSWANEIRNRVAGWRERVAADLAACAPEPEEEPETRPAAGSPVTDAAKAGVFTVDPATGGIVHAGPGRSESVREFLARTPHLPVTDLLAVAEPLDCVCGELRAAAIHGQGHGRPMLDAVAYLATFAAELEAGRPAGPWNPDGAHEYTEDDEQAGICECGSPQGNWKHREVPAGAGSVTSDGGWLSGSMADGTTVTGPLSDAESAHSPLVSAICAELYPEAAPPAPVPESILGYVVVLRGLARDGLADADLRRTLEAALSDAAGHGRRPGWNGRADACQVTPVIPGWLAGEPEWCGRGLLAAGSLRTAEARQ